MAAASLEVLLVDHDDVFAVITSECLRRAGHRVRVAKSAARATALASIMKPDAVLLDPKLPDCDGHTIARILRDELPRTTPIIVVTGMRDATFVEGIDMMLSKPVAPELLGSLLEYLCRQRFANVIRPT